MLAGRFRKNSMFLEGNCCWELDNSGCLRGFDVEHSCYVLSEFCPITTPKVTINVRTYVCLETSQYVRLQVVGAPSLLAWNASISGSEGQINFSQQIPKMFKMASESSIHALLFFLGFISQNFPLGAPEVSAAKLNSSVF